MSNMCYAAKTLLKGKFIAKLIPILERKRCHKSVVTASSLRIEKRENKLKQEQENKLSSGNR